MNRRAPAVTLLVSLAVAACARPVEEDMPFAEYLEEAALTYEVPRSILVGIAATETGLVMRTEDPDGDEHGRGCFGVMGLCAGEGLEKAAALLRVPVEKVKTDPRTNILAAAALLAEHKRAAEKGGWEEALRRFGARGSVEGGAIFAREVLSHAALDLGYLTREDLARPDSSGARWIPSPNFTPANRGRGQIRKIVIHTAQGSYAGTISWFQNTRSEVSAHYVIRSRDGEITQMVEEKDIAWHVRCWNGDTIGIEHEGFVSDPGTWYTDAMYRSSARLVREIAARYGIPLDRDHILGHNDVSRLSGGCTTHTDPGPGWDWTKFMALVRANSEPPAPAPQPATGVFRGVVYDAARSISDASNRIRGATVRLSNGMSTTTGSTGSYAFRVPPGTYSVTVSAPGWSTVTVTRTVTAGRDVWGSAGLRRVAATGKYLGVVYDASRPLSDPSNRIAGATVRLSNGMTVVTSSSGFFSFTVPAGQYTATASKSGFSSGSSTRHVPAGGEVWGSIGIRR